MPALKGDPDPSTPFTRTFSSLLRDSSRTTTIAIGIAATVLLAWCLWASLFQVTLHELASEARIEVDAATFQIQSPFVGRLVSAPARIGMQVREGDVLFELDAQAERLRVQEERVRAAGIAPELSRLQSELTAEQRARVEERSSAQLNVEEASSRLRAAQADANYADAELERARSLQEQRLLSQRDLQKARFDAERLRATAATAASAARREPHEQATRERERDVRVERLQSQIASLESEYKALAASIERLEYEIERRSIRAPAAGVIAESAQLRPGAVVDEGTHLVSIVSSGRLIVAAQLPARSAFGRVRRGQNALLRLEGFPWAEFGAVSATVTDVARESRAGSVRVELAIDRASKFRGPIEHGMPGSLEIAVERVTPLQLLLRTVGRQLTLQ